MKVIARDTIKNAFGFVLFFGGKSYEIIKDDLGRYFASNELNKKTPLKKADIDKYFAKEEA